jgi:hypothetical protein
MRAPVALGAACRPSCYHFRGRSLLVFALAAANRRVTVVR